MEKSLLWHWDRVAQGVWLELGLVRVAVVGTVTVTRMSCVARGTGWMHF